MGIPNMHSTIDYKRLIELQANKVDDVLLVENVNRGKVKQIIKKSNRVTTRKR